MSWARTVRLPHEEAALHVCPRSGVLPASAPEWPGVAAPRGGRRSAARHPAA
ncbi:hypothetical protein [Streptomyces sp. NPDC017520]|uniref:hypothetical protein n=1 Tax=Streptomyces sp. NPDC017520 TaxID=3364998 RepID=UPI0037B071B4